VAFFPGADENLSHSRVPSVVDQRIEKPHLMEPDF
jgi:hypothetical protein